jgi:hypothetical protein
MMHPSSNCKPLSLSCAHHIQARAVHKAKLRGILNLMRQTVGFAIIGEMLPY